MRKYEIGETMSDEDSLAHYGVKGMKWGRRRGKGVTGVSRRRGIVIDRNNRTADIIKKAQSGEKYKGAAFVGRKLIGAEQQKKNWETGLANLNAQNERLRTGKATITDRLDIAMSMNLVDLLVTRTPR